MTTTLYTHSRLPFQRIEKVEGNIRQCWRAAWRHARKQIDTLEHLYQRPLGVTTSRGENLARIDIWLPDGTANYTRPTPLASMKLA